MNGIECKSLLDTGSTVSTVSSTFYGKELKDKCEIHSLLELLEIEAASGHNIPYLGYVELDISIPCLNIEESIPVLMLVVADTDYNSKVPLLLGTNVLISVMDKFPEGVQNRKNESSFPWQLAFKTVKLQEHSLKRHNNCLGLVKSTRTVRIGSNCSVIVSGLVSNKLSYRNCMITTCSSSKSKLPDELDITPVCIILRLQQ